MGILVPLTILLPIGMFIYKNNYSDRPLTIIFCYLVAAGLINATAVTLAKNGIRNLPLLHLYTVVETVFFLSYFYLIFNSAKIKRFLIYVMIAFAIFCIINLAFIQSIFTHNTHTRPLEALIITSTCLLYLYRTGFSEDWLGSPINWINVGILMYFPAASLIFILSNYFTFIMTDDEMTSLIWNLHAFMVFGMYLFITKAFSLIRRKNNV